MNLLSSCLYDPAAAVSKATSALLAMTALDTTNLRVTVTVPAHGRLKFKLRCAIVGATTPPVILLGVLNGATVVGRVIPLYTPVTAPAATQVFIADAELSVGGLTPGSTSFDAAYAVQVIVASTNIKYGGPNTNAGANAWGAFVFEAWDPQPLTVALDGAVNVKQWNGTAVAAPATAGVPEVNVKAINNISSSPVTTVKAVQGLTTADTIATYTGNTPQTGDSFARIGAAGVGLTNLGDTRIANLDATVSSRTKPADTQAAVTTVTTTTNLTNLPSIPANWLTAAGIAASALNGKGDWNIGKTGYALSAAGIQAIWDALTSALTTVGSIGKFIVDNADSAGITTLLSRLTAGRATNLDNLDATVSSRSTYAGGDTSGTTTLLSRLSAGRATNLDNLDLTVSSRLPTSSYVAPDNSDILLIKAKTDNLPAAPAAVGDIPTAIQNADTFLKRDMSAVSGESSRSPLNAFRFLRNKFSTSLTPGVVSIMKEDDTTVAYTKTITTDPASEPIVEG